MLPKLVGIALNCPKLHEIGLHEIAENYPKLLQIASNCFELRHENLKKIENCMPQPKKVAEIGRNCLKLPEIA